MVNTKKSLIFSALSLLLCCALLAGTTFAWFTDSVTNTGNKIQAGNLAINAYAYDIGEGGESFTITDVNNSMEFTFEAQAQDLKEENCPPIINDELWEPGKSNAKLLKVENAGTLAVKIKLDFETAGDLTDALWFDFIQVESGEVTGSFTKRPMNTLSTFAKDLELPIIAKGDKLEFILVYGMYEEAGNEYKETDFTANVSILAAQYTYEKDGFGNTDYDKDAEYVQRTYISGQNGSPITAEQLAEVLNDPENPNIGLQSDAVLSETINLYTDTDINLNNNNITLDNKTFYIGRNNGYSAEPMNLSLHDGTVIVSGFSGRLRAEDGSSATFRDMVFKSADMTAREALQVYASKDASKNTYVFENCTFENTYVSFEGGSGSAYEFNVKFVNCTFTGSFGNGTASVALDDYIYGTAVFENCTFNVTAKGNATAAIKADTYQDYVKPNTMDISLNNVTFIGTSTSRYRPVPVYIKSKDAVRVVESGDCNYTTDSVSVNYKGEQ